MDQIDKFCQLFVAKFLFYDFLEVGAFLDAVAVDIFVDPKNYKSYLITYHL